MVDPNTRTGKRTPVTLKIKFKSETLDQFIERYAVDVSQGGIFIRTKEPLPVGTQMRFEFQLRDASPLIGGEGTVVWTRENDPSRPAIAPGMGVRFDRLAEGSQAVLERILSEKAKQAPQRNPSESTKPPLFTDTPTRVAPAPIQEQLLGGEKPRRRPGEEEHTPLPKPMPFHSDADEFPDEAFEEATKVRALDELVAQTALDPHAPAAATPSPATPEPARGAYTELDSAPGLPSPPEAASKGGRMLDASPSPRNTEPPPIESPSKTRLGVEAPPPRMPMPAMPSGPNSAPGPGPSIGGPMSAPSLKEGPPGVRAVAAEPTSPVRMAAPSKGGSGAAIAVLILVLLAAGAAGVWFFVLREKAVEHAATTQQGSGSAGSGSAGSAAPSGGSGAIATGPGSAGSGSAAPEAPKGPVVDTIIDSSTPKATVEIVGSDQSGPAPFTAKLEKDKPFKARVSAAGFVVAELDVIGGAAKQTATLQPKPRVIEVTSDPAGALISVDSSTIGKVTPFEVELTKSQAAKKYVRVRLYKNGFRAVEKMIQADAYTEEAGRMHAKVDEKLSVQIQIKQPPPGDGSAAPSGGTTTPPGDGSAAPSGGTTTPPPATPPATPPAAPPSTPSEPEPEFTKQQ